jgi:hypothetical protein
MLRVPSLLFAAITVLSVSAFAADTPDPSSKGGESAVPSGSNVIVPNSPPAGTPSLTENKPNLPAPATSPGEENKGKPNIKTE